MRYTWLCINCMLVGCIFSSCGTAKQDVTQLKIDNPTPFTCNRGDTLLVWSDKTKLKMSDFRGPVNDSISYEVTALSNIGICYEYTVKTGRLDINLYAIFNRYKSWEEPFNESDTLIILNHEQRHFDIEELTRRMIIKGILDEQIEPFTLEDQSRMFETAVFYIGWDFGKRTQTNYDEETRHGRNIAEQARWDKKIDSLLLVTQDYKTQSISLIVTDSVYNSKK